MACGICGSDIPRVYVTGSYHFPTVLGHEFSGEIVEVADDVSSEYLGKKAAVFPLYLVMSVNIVNRDTTHNVKITIILVQEQMAGLRNT